MPRFIPARAAVALLWMALVGLAPAAVAGPAGTAFSYQGHFSRDGEPLNQNCQVTFRLFDADAGGVQIGGDVVQQATFDAGLLSVDLDFGAGAFGPDERWLELELLCVGDASGTVLAPRQRIRPVPGSLYSASTGALQGNPVDGSIPQLGDILLWDGTAWVPGPELQELVAELQTLREGAYILGPSAWTDNGAWQFAGEYGVQAAEAACQAAYPGEPFAHFCSLAEIEQAVARKNFPASPTFDDVWTWSGTPGKSTQPTTQFDDSLGNNCEGLKSYSSEGFYGTRVKVDFDYFSQTNGTDFELTPVFVVEVDVHCTNIYPVMCCR